jgi:hypothetical protein
MAEHTNCIRCGRKLTSSASAARGYGRTCQAKMRQAEAAATGYSPAQVAAAHELIEDGAIVQIRPRVCRSVSSDGTALYLTAITGQCNCPAGLRSTRCYHALAAALLLAA